MSANPLLSVFPAPLLRLILCGGEGLPAAYGPLDGSASSSRYSDAVWNPARGEAYAEHEYTVGVLTYDGNLTTEATGWRLPLDHWRARLALVAAWMMWHSGHYSAVVLADSWRDQPAINLMSWSPRVGLPASGWSDRLGAKWCSTTGVGLASRDIPTLPAHLTQHDPAVALLLSLYDVPEIRARIAS